MYLKKISIEDRMPPIGKWVTTIDTAGEHRVYRLYYNGIEHAWNMRDADGCHSPNNNLVITHWLEEVDNIVEAIPIEQAQDSNRTVQIKAEFLLEIKSYQEWINRVPGILPEKTSYREKWIWLDKHGNILENGLDFMEADRIQSYPCRIYKLIPVSEATNYHSKT